MEFPYPLLFVVLLAGYLIYSVRTGLDPRYPIGGALVLLGAAAVAEAAGATGPANVLAEYVFLLLAGGVVLLLVDHLGAGRGSARTPVSGTAEGTSGDAAEPAQERQRTAEQALDRPEQ